MEGMVACPLPLFAEGDQEDGRRGEQHLLYAPSGHEPTRLSPGHESVGGQSDPVRSRPSFSGRPLSRVLPGWIAIGETY